MKQVVCLISGRGSNLRALVQAAQSQQWEQSVPARIAAVIGNRADAPGLTLARAHGLPTEVVAHGDYTTRAAFEAALAQAIDVYRPDLVVLAGFMRVLTGEFVRRYQGALINIHPSLLPAFPGLHTHRQALAAGVRIHGCTVHFVSDAVDDGAIIGQAAVRVRGGDTEATLAERVLAAEHRLLPDCVRYVLAGRVRLADGRAQVDAAAADDLARVCA